MRLHDGRKRAARGAGFPQAGTSSGCNRPGREIICTPNPNTRRGEPRPGQQRVQRSPTASAASFSICFGVGMRQLSCRSEREQRRPASFAVWPISPATLACAGVWLVVAFVPFFGRHATSALFASRLSVRTCIASSQRCRRSGATEVNVEKRHNRSCTACYLSSLRLVDGSSIQETATKSV